MSRVWDAGAWTGDSGAFERLIVNGIPGYVMPANGDLSGRRSRTSAGIHQLRALQQGARHRELTTMTRFRCTHVIALAIGILAILGGVGTAWAYSSIR